MGRVYDDYDAQTIYKEKIEPLLETLKAECKERGIPFFFSIITSYGTKGFTFKRDALTPMALFHEDGPRCDMYKHILMGKPQFIAVAGQQPGQQPD
jgi:hypothetical protein